VPVKNSLNSDHCGIVQHADVRYHCPRTESVHQKLRLLSALAIHVIHRVGPIDDVYLRESLMIKIALLDKYRF
jgi:hypothetical protein